MLEHWKMATLIAKEMISVARLRVSEIKGAVGCWKLEITIFFPAIAKNGLDKKISSLIEGASFWEKAMKELSAFSTKSDRIMWRVQCLNGVKFFRQKDICVVEARYQINVADGAVDLNPPQNIYAFNDRLTQNVFLVGEKMPTKPKRKRRRMNGV